MKPIKLIPPENLAFFKRRQNEVTELQQEIEDFFKETQKIAEENSKILLSVNFPKLIMLTKKTASDFFQIKSSVSRIQFRMFKIEIVYQEYCYPHYTSDVNIRFYLKLPKDNSNQPFLSCRLSSLDFDHSGFQLFESATGNRVLELFFYNSDDYFAAKNQILKAREELEKLSL
jgi:hypothetical protein